MQLIKSLTDDPKQTINVILPDNTTLNLYLEFKQSLDSWFFDLNWNDTFYLYGKKLVTSVNLLRQFKRIITFGLTVSSQDALDPCLLSDFINNGTNISNSTLEYRRITLIVLDSTDLEYLETNYYV